MLKLVPRVVFSVRASNIKSDEDNNTSPQQFGCCRGWSWAWHLQVRSAMTPLWWPNLISMISPHCGLTPLYAVFFQRGKGSREKKRKSKEKKNERRNKDWKSTNWSHLLAGELVHWPVNESNSQYGIWLANATPQTMSIMLVNTE